MCRHKAKNTQTHSFLHIQKAKCMPDYVFKIIVNVERTWAPFHLLQFTINVDRNALDHMFACQSAVSPTVSHQWATAAEKLLPDTVIMHSWGYEPVNHRGSVSIIILITDWFIEFMEMMTRWWLYLSWGQISRSKFDQVILANIPLISPIIHTHCGNPRCRLSHQWPHWLNWQQFMKHVTAVRSHGALLSHDWQFYTLTHTNSGF